MNKTWLWDLKISLEESKDILKDDKNERFLDIAALLLSRNNEPKEIFREYLDRRIFANNWIKIKKKMRQNSWTDPRVIFWQAIYEAIKRNGKKQGISTSVRRSKRERGKSTEIAKKIYALRKEAGFTQKELAGRINVSQQIISRIEGGYGDIRLMTLKKICEALGYQLEICTEKKKDKPGVKKADNLKIDNLK